MLYVGLDVHQGFYVMALLEGSGKTVRTIKVRGSHQRLIQRLRREAAGRPVAVCFEASCDYGLLHDRLCQVAQRVVVAHPASLRLIYRNKRKHDRVDAASLAKLLALDLVPAVHVPGLDVRAWRRLIQHRRSLIQQRTAIKARLRALLRTYALRAPRGVWSQRLRPWWLEQPWPGAADRWQVQQLLTQLDHLELMVKQATGQLDQLGRAHPGVALLRTQPGIGARTAEALAAWIDSPQRFARNKQVGAYFGLVPCQDQSAGRNHLGHITKDGPSGVRQLLVEAAWVAIGKDAALRADFDRIVAGDPDRRKIAIVAIARRLAIRAVAMLKTGEVYHQAAA